MILCWKRKLVIFAFLLNRFYNQGEVKDFEGNECEYPLFYTFMIIDGVFRTNTEQIEEYQAELRNCMHADANGDPVIIHYYAPDGEGGYTKPVEGPLFLWGQSVFIIAQLLTSGLLHINELDAIRRYLPSYNRPRKGGRYSAFQVLQILFYSKKDLNRNFRMSLALCLELKFGKTCFLIPLQNYIKLFFFFQNLLKFDF